MSAAQLYQRKWLLIRLPIAVLALAVMAWLWLACMPLPPADITLSAGRPDGVYFAHAQRYAAKFAERGIQLNVVASEGALQNLRRLHGHESPAADLAFIQGGVDNDSLGGGKPLLRLQSIAKVDLEPVWIFSRQASMDSLQQLQGQRVSLGPPGSGTRLVALALLEQARLGLRDVVDSPLAGLEAVEALRQGNLDALVLVQAPQSPVVAALLAMPSVHLVQLKRTAALTERLPFLQASLLPQGALDPQGRYPARDATVLVTSATLVTRESLDPALQRLAARITQEVHGGGGLMHAAGTFPSLKRLDFAASPQAREVLVHGLPWLEDWLPFWTAQVLQRLLLICLPVALLALWLAHLVPAYFRWLVESRVTRWYGELKYIEHDLNKQAVSGLEQARFMSRLDSMEKRMADLVIPADLMPRWYLLRQHIDFVRLYLYRQRGR